MTIRLTSVLLLALFAGGACTSFDPIARSVCGNGLLEPGEDCDSSAASCSACSVVCSAATDCPSSAYTCGVDGLCHAPAGTFGTPSAPTVFPVNDMRVTDIDKDGIGDVLGVSKTSLIVRYGDSTGVLAATDQTLTPIQGDVTSFSDLDADGALDVALATADGIVLYTSPFDKLSPVSSRTPIGVPSATVESLFSIDSFSYGAIISHDANHQLELVIGSLFDPAHPVGITGPLSGQFCGGRLTNAAFVPGRVDVYRATDSLVVVDFVVSLTGGSPTGPQTCVLAVHIDLSQPEGDRAKFYDTTPGTAPLSKMILADLKADADPCPHLVATQVDLPTPRLVVWDGTMTGAGSTLHCTLAMVPRVLSFDPDSVPSVNATAVGQLFLDPPLAFTEPDGIVLSDGVYALVGATLYRVYSATRPITRAVSGDFDGNGTLDLVATTEAQDDLDILYRTGTGFQLYRVNTASRVTSTSVGDFDGNGVADVAYVEPVEGHQRMMITYGTRDRLLEPVEVSTFKDVLSIGIINLQGSLDQLGIVDDLLVVDRPLPNQTVVTLLQGSAQRTMLSYFEPRSTSINDIAVTAFGAALDGVVVGKFFEGASLTAVAFGHATIDLPGAGPGGAAGAGRLWPMTVSPEAGLDPVLSGLGAALPGGRGCESGVETDALCLPTTQYVVWPLATHDVVIAVDRQVRPHAATITAMTSALVTTTPNDVMVANVPAGAVVHTLAVVDLDGDGTNELLATFGPDGARLATTAGLVELCAVDAAGKPTSCENVGAAIPDASTCIDATPGRFTTGSAATSLVVLCYGPDDDARRSALLYRVTRAVDGLHADLITGAAGLLRAIRSGDVTGDGVDDLIGLAGIVGSQSLVVVPQCTSRTPECGK